jgi:hypothetical protein
MSRLILFYQINGKNMICDFVSLHNSNFPSTKKMNKMQTLKRSGQTKVGSQLNSINLKSSGNNIASPVIPSNDVSLFK